MPRLCGSKPNQEIHAFQTLASANNLEANISAMMIKSAIENLGAERLAFGTDSILNTAERFREMREEFRKDHISDHDLDLIFGGSAARILGLYN